MSVNPEHLEAVKPETLAKMRARFEAERPGGAKLKENVIDGRGRLIELTFFPRPPWDLIETHDCGDFEGLMWQSTMAGIAQDFEGARRLNELEAENAELRRKLGAAGEQGGAA